jgi:tetratricopeptide (TPR) repeat protein
MWGAALAQLTLVAPVQETRGFDVVKNRLAHLLEGLGSSGIAERVREASPHEIPAIIRIFRRMGLGRVLSERIPPEMEEELRRQSIALRAHLLGSNHPRDHFNRGLALELAGRTKEARRAYWTVFMVDPEEREAEIHVLACLNLSRLYLNEGRYREAAELAERGLQIDSDRLDVRSNYAHALLGLGRLFFAVHQWSVVLDKVNRLKERGWSDPKIDTMVQDILGTLRRLAEAVSRRGEYDIERFIRRILSLYESKG